MKTFALRAEVQTVQNIGYRTGNRDLWCLIYSWYKNIGGCKKFSFLEFSNYLFCIFENDTLFICKHQYFIIIFEVLFKNTK